jgi:hypothetical protein
MISVQGDYVFNILGDGTSTEILIPLRALKAPDPAQGNWMPSGLFGATIAGGSNTVIATLEGEMVRLKFASAPSATKPLTITLQALFGVDRIG